MGSLNDLPGAWLSLAFTESDGEFCVKWEYRDSVHFVQQDIRREMPAGVFQLVLCRHVVFTYFDEPLQQAVLQRMVTKLAAGGILVTGKQEPLPVRESELRETATRMGVYRL
jgi:chemotaxis protein methyltransferase CheR